MDQILLWVLCMMMAGICLWRIRIAKRGEWQEDFLSLPVSKALLGVFAVLIVLHHLQILQLRKTCFPTIMILSAAIGSSFRFLNITPVPDNSKIFYAFSSDKKFIRSKSFSNFFHD